MENEQRGLRFPFDGRAEIFVENSTEKSSGQVTELSLRGCFLATSFSPSENRLRIKIWHADQFFEASAEVLYVRATGLGLVFTEMKQYSRVVLQNWIIAALDKQAKYQPT
jgi:PilZ domain